MQTLNWPWPNGKETILGTTNEAIADVSDYVQKKFVGVAHLRKQLISMQRLDDRGPHPPLFFYSEYTLCLSEQLRPFRLLDFSANGGHHRVH